MFLSKISEIIIVKNLKLHKFLKHSGCPRGEGVTWRGRGKEVGEEGGR